MNIIIKILEMIIKKLEWIDLYINLYNSIWLHFLSNEHFAIIIGNNRLIVVIKGSEVKGIVVEV